MKSFLKKFILLFLSSPLSGASFSTRGLDIRLFDAVKENNIEKAKYVLSIGAKVNARYDVNEFTPLMIVSSIEMINLLLEKGADINARDARGWTPLMIMAISLQREPKIIEHLLKKGADQKIILNKDMGPFRKGMNFVDMIDKVLALEDNKKLLEIKQLAIAYQNPLKPDTKTLKELAKPKKASGSPLLEKKTRLDLYQGVLAIENPVILLRKVLTPNAIALELPLSLRVPSSGDADIQKFFINSPQAFLSESYIENPYAVTFADLEKGTYKKEKMFQFFHECPCIPREIRSQYSGFMINLMTDLYNKREKDIPFVYTSFSANKLFNDVYMLTRFIENLKNEGITNINLIVNLIDPAFAPYINFIKSAEHDIIHLRPSKFFKRMKKDFPIEHYVRLNYTLHQFLRWFEHYLNVKIHVNLYHSGNDYSYDILTKKMLQSDVISAVDYTPEQQGDIAVLIAGALKVDGIFGSVIGQAFQLSIDEGDEGDEPSQTKTVEESSHLITMIISKKVNNIPVKKLEVLSKFFKKNFNKMARVFYPLMHGKKDFLHAFEYKNALKALAKAKIGFDVMEFFDREKIKIFKVTNGKVHAS